MEYYLQISGLVFCLRIPRTLQIGKTFAPFMTHTMAADVIGEFQPVTQLELPQTAAVYEEVCCRGYVEQGKFRRSFRREPDCVESYAIAEACEGGVRVTYLPDSEECFRELGQCFSHMGLEGLLLEQDRLCIHAACVDTALGGILFAGPSGIGKSTQAELWCRYRGGIQINGDRPILSRGSNQWLAWGSPYAGSSGVHLNANCPIRAVVILEQSPQCKIRRLGQAEAFRKIYSCLTVNRWSGASVMRACDLVQELLDSVLVYEFACTPDLQAVEILEREIGKDGE